MADRAALEKERDELMARIKSIKADIRGGLSADWSEQATELENRDTLLEIQRVSEERLADVTRQLAALED